MIFTYYTDYKGGINNLAVAVEADNRIISNKQN